MASVGLVAVVLAPSLFPDAGVVVVVSGILGLVLGASLAGLALVLHTLLEWRARR